MNTERTDGGGDKSLEERISAEIRQEAKGLSDDYVYANYEDAASLMRSAANRYDELSAQDRNSERHNREIEKVAAQLREREAAWKAWSTLAEERNQAAELAEDRRLEALERNGDMSENRSPGDATIGTELRDPDHDGARDFRHLSQSERLQDSRMNAGAKAIAALDAAIDRKYGADTPEADKMKRAALESVAQTLEQGERVAVPRVLDVEQQREAATDFRRAAEETRANDLSASVTAQREQAVDAPDKPYSVLSWDEEDRDYRVVRVQLSAGEALRLFDELSREYHEGRHDPANLAGFDYVGDVQIEKDGDDRLAAGMYSLHNPVDPSRSLDVDWASPAFVNEALAELAPDDPLRDGPAGRGWDHLTYSGPLAWRINEERFQPRQDDPRSYADRFRDGKAALDFIAMTQEERLQDNRLNSAAKQLVAIDAVIDHKYGGRSGEADEMKRAARSAIAESLANGVKIQPPHLHAERDAARAIVRDVERQREAGPDQARQHDSSDRERDREDR